MQYLGAILIQSAIAMFSAIVAWQSYNSFKRTRDMTFRLFSIAFGLFVVHILAQLTVLFFDQPYFVKPLLIFARGVLFIGILFFIQTPIFKRSYFLRKNNMYIISLSVIIIILFSYIHFTGDSTPFVSEYGMAVESIDSLPAQLLMASIPLLSATAWVYLLITAIPVKVTNFFRYKVYFLCIGVVNMAIGNVVYIFSSQSIHSLVGISIVVAGYFLVAFAVTMPSVRRLLY